MSSNEYIKKHIDEIMTNKDLEYPQNLAMAAAWICGNFKAENLKVLDLTEMSSLADYFVLASAGNSTQAKSIAEVIAKQLKEYGAEVISKEGLQETDWILIDLGDIIIHVFQEMSREVYDLDNLWSKAPRIEIPADYYMAEAETEEKKKKEDIDFF